MADPERKLVSLPEEDSGSGFIVKTPKDFESFYETLRDISIKKESEKEMLRLSGTQIGGLFEYEETYFSCYTNYLESTLKLSDNITSGQTRGTYEPDRVKKIKQSILKFLSDPYVEPIENPHTIILCTHKAFEDSYFSLSVNFGQTGSEERVRLEAELGTIDPPSADLLSPREYGFKMAEFAKKTQERRMEIERKLGIQKNAQIRINCNPGISSYFPSYQEFSIFFKNFQFFYPQIIEAIYKEVQLEPPKITVQLTIPESGLILVDKDSVFTKREEK